MNATTVRVNRRASEIRLTLDVSLRTGGMPRCLCRTAHVWADHGQTGVPA